MPSLASSKEEFVRDFKVLYEQELGALRPCAENAHNEVKLCSDVLRNEGNAPFALFPDSPKATVVLFHGLADSPYYLHSIAEHFYRQDYAVIVPLMPGHGKLSADADMQDPNLKQRWYDHVDRAMALANNNSDRVFIGGFSAGGTLATHYMLKQPEKVQGLLLFSGALQLSSSAETMSSIWGMKSLAVWLDGDFQTQGPNLYRYPKVASYSGLVLMDVIKEIRSMLADAKAMQSIEKPIFTAHSMADNISPYSGIENLLTKVPGNHTQFKIDTEFDVCHRDVVISPLQAITMNFDKSKVNQSERCAVPKANPLHSTMLSVMTYFVAEHTK
jgi:esterase/lipase